MAREDVDKLIRDVTRRQEEAEAEAHDAAEELMRQASGIKLLEEVNAKVVGAAADTYIAALERHKELVQIMRELRGLPM